MATILSISDDIKHFENQTKLLEEAGHKVMIAPDKATAIGITQIHSVDAVLLDASIIGTDEAGILDLLMEEQPNLPLAIVSGSSLESVPEPLKWYADALLQENDEAEVFLSAIEKMLHIGAAKKFLGKRRIIKSEQLIA